MRRRLGLLARSQARDLAAWAESSATAEIMRARISAAALRVKVTARISSGSATCARSRTKRCVKTLVLPEPAGACSTIDAAGSVAAARACASGGAILFALFIFGAFAGLIVNHSCALGDAAQTRNIAV